MQAASRGWRWWSGAGSNCRPSAFQRSYRGRPPYIRGRLSTQFTRIAAGQWVCTIILAAVPQRAGEYRFVRVTSVLIMPSARTCVALVLATPGRSAATRAPVRQHGRADHLPPLTSIRCLLAASPGRQSRRRIALTHRDKRNHMRCEIPPIAPTICGYRELAEFTPDLPVLRSQPLPAVGGMPRRSCV